MLKGVNSLLSNPDFQATQAYVALCTDPLGFIDIGARGGVHPLVEPLAGATSVLAFDADEAECKRLEEELAQTSPFAGMRIIPAAIAGQSGPATLYRFAKPTNDSLLPENPVSVQRYNITTCERIGTLSLQTQNLDKILFGPAPIPARAGEFMKIDAQGADLDIVKGAQRALEERTVAILVETCFFPQYLGSPLFSEIELYLREKGFFFFGFETMHYRSNNQFNKHAQHTHERIHWADCVFFKDPIPVGFEQKELSERGVYVLFTSAILTGYYDFALELALKTWADDAERKRVERLIQGIAHFPSEDTFNQLMDLTERVKANPSQANFEVGRFVDNRRWVNDYDNVPPFRQI